jgi:homoserine dehydrogenase
LVFGAGAVGVTMYIRDMHQKQGEIQRALDEAKAAQQRAEEKERFATQEGMRANDERKKADQAQQEAQAAAEDFKTKLLALEARVKGASLEELKKLQSDINSEKGKVVTPPKAAGPVTTPNLTSTAGASVGDPP